jgi:O-antigen/teichoic acid export membrane protein
LARNVMLNFVGQIIPLLAAVFTIPYVIGGLGEERFGILSLSWVIFGYFGFFDLGLGRATTKYVAELLAQNQMGRIAATVWTSLFIQLILGLLGSVVLAVTTPFLAGGILKMSPDLIAEAKTMFYILAGALTVEMCLRSFRGCLEAKQRFDMVNVVQIFLNSFIFLVPLMGIFLGLGLAGIVLSLVIARTAGAIVYMALCFRIFPQLTKSVSLDRNLFVPLFTYGWWVTVCNMLAPVLASIERFFIVAIVSAAALTYYTVPYEAISRILIFPGAVGMTLFPAFSMLAAVNRKDLERIYVRSLKYTILALTPVVCAAVIFAHGIFRLWLGETYVVKSALVFQILAIGMLLNAFAQIPANLLDGVGRPDLRAKIFFCYVLFYIGLVWALTSKYGIVGAALAWTIRAGIEVVLFFGSTWWLMRFRPAAFLENGFFRGVILCAVLVSIAVVMTLSICNMRVSYIAAVISVVIFFLVAWRYCLDSVDKKEFRAMLSR